jgi:vacuolar-type H+-ATPase subunit I/STV1
MNLPPHNTEPYFPLMNGPPGYEPDPVIVAALEQLRLEYIARAARWRARQEEDERLRVALQRQAERLAAEAKAKAAELAAERQAALERAEAIRLAAEREAARIRIAAELEAREKAAARQRLRVVDIRAC